MRDADRARTPLAGCGDEAPHPQVVGVGAIPTNRLRTVPGETKETDVPRTGGRQ